MKRILLASAALSLSTAFATAQTTPTLDGLVNVNIQDVLQDIAVDLQIEDTNIPVTLQVPISLAANVCDVDVGVLSAQLDTGEAQCTAVTGSQELTQIVQQEMNAGDSTDDTASDDSDPTDDTASGDDSSSDDTASDTSDDQTDDTDDTASDDTDQSEADDVASDDDEATDDTTTSSTNSAREFAPGQQDESANEVAPGKQDDPKAAAPGQMKKMEEEVN